MSDNQPNSKPPKPSKSILSRANKSVEGEKITPLVKNKSIPKVLATRKIRHYQTETLHIIKQSMGVITPNIEKDKKSQDYSQAITAFKKELSQLADTLTSILTKDPDEHNAVSHHDLLAHYFERPGSDENGVHLVATSNIEAISEDLNLSKNTREYNWLMNNGVNLLEYEILNRISQEMTQLENTQKTSVNCQQERSLEMQDIIEKTQL